MPISAHTEKIVRILDSMFAYRYYTYKQIEDRLFEKGIELGTRQIQNIMIIPLLISNSNSFR